MNAMEDGLSVPEIEVTASEDLPPPQSSEADAEEELERARRRKRGSMWRRPRTKVYMDNFNFSVNGYQPLIDYLDAKDSGETVKKDVHIPFLDERCMRQYHATKPFKLYTNSDIDRYIVKGENIRTQIRQNDAAGASSVLRRTHTNWSMTRKYVQLVKQSHVVDYRLLHPEWYSRSGSKSPLSASPRRSLSVERSLSPRPRMTAQVLTNTPTILPHNALEHGTMMALRKERLRQLDDQFEDVVRQMSDTVKRMNSAMTTRAADVSQGTAAMVNDEADRLMVENRLRRNYEIEKLAQEVEELTTLGNLRTKLKSIRNLENDVLGVDDHAADLVLQRAHAARPVLTEPEIEEPRRPRRKVPDGNVMSDVHVRILNRASEMSGVTSEVRRIQNMARYMNPFRVTVPVGYETDDLKPSKVELNIDHMAKTFASSGKPVRRWTVDEEGELPVSNPNTKLIRRYCAREIQEPIRVVPSDSTRVRNAVLRARFRNSLLHH